MNRKILIADDLKPIRMILRRILDKISSDWDIEEASCGEEALDRIYWSEPDIVLLDVQLPKKNGWEILSSVREADGKTMVVMVTASESPEDVQKAVDLGASGFVGKPFDQNEIAQALGVVA